MENFSSVFVFVFVFVVVVVLWCVCTFWVPCSDVHYDFRIKTMFGSSCLQLFVRGSMSYYMQGRIQGGRARRTPPLKLVKIWFFTRNTPKIFAPPSAGCDFFKCAPPPNLKSWIRPWYGILFMLGSLTFDGYSPNHVFRSL